MNAAEQYATATQSFIKHTHPLHTPQHSAYLTDMQQPPKASLSTLIRYILHSTRLT